MADYVKVEDMFQDDTSIVDAGEDSGTSSVEFIDEHDISDNIVNCSHMHFRIGTRPIKTEPSIIPDVPDVISTLPYFSIIGDMFVDKTLAIPLLPKQAIISAPSGLGKTTFAQMVRQYFRKDPYQAERQQVFRALQIGQHYIFQDTFASVTYVCYLDFRTMSLSDIDAAVNVIIYHALVECGYLDEAFNRNSLYEARLFEMMCKDSFFVIIDEADMYYLHRSFRTDESQYKKYLAHPTLGQLYSNLINFCYNRVSTVEKSCRVLFTCTVPTFFQNYSDKIILYDIIYCPFSYFMLDLDDCENLINRVGGTTDLQRYPHWVAGYNIKDKIFVNIRLFMALIYKYIKRELNNKVTTGWSVNNYFESLILHPDIRKNVISLMPNLVSKQCFTLRPVNSIDYTTLSSERMYCQSWYWYILIYGGYLSTSCIHRSNSTLGLRITNHYALEQLLTMCDKDQTQMISDKEVLQKKIRDSLSLLQWQQFFISVQTYFLLLNVRALRYEDSYVTTLRTILEGSSVFRNVSHQPDTGEGFTDLLVEIDDKTVIIFEVKKVAVTKKPESVNHQLCELYGAMWQIFDKKYFIPYRNCENIILIAMAFKGKSVMEYYFNYSDNSMLNNYRRIVNDAEKAGICNIHLEKLQKKRPDNDAKCFPI